MIIIFKKSAKSKLVIDIGTNNIKIIEVEERHGYFYVLKHMMIKTPDGIFEDGIISDPDKLSNLLEHELKASGFKSKNVIATITSHHILSRDVILPKGNLKEMTFLVDAEAPNQFPIDISQHSVDFKVLEEVIEDDIPKYKVLILVTPLNILESYVSVFEHCGLFLEKIDFKGNSITKLIKQNEKSMMFEQMSTNAVLDIGCDSSSLTISNNGIIKYSRTLPFGSSEYNKELINLLGCSEDEAEETKITYGVLSDTDESDEKQEAVKKAWEQLSIPLFDEVSRVFDFFASRHDANSIDRIMLTGGGSLIPQLVSYMQKSFDMQIEFLTCEETIGFAEPDIDLTNFSIYFSNCVGAVFNE